MHLSSLFIFVVSGCLGFSCFSQTHATPVWPFLCERYAYSSTMDVQISKTASGGQLVLSIEAPDSISISGTTYLFLQNNTVITCTDKNKRGTVGSKISSYYILNAAEMKQLQQHRIEYIHFNTKGNSKKSLGQLGNFTAINKKSYFQKNTAENPNYFDTAADCRALYN